VLLGRSRVCCFWDGGKCNKSLVENKKEKTARNVGDEEEELP
jgi:hypothetical protein